MNYNGKNVAGMLIFMAFLISMVHLASVAGTLTPEAVSPTSQVIISAPSVLFATEPKMNATIILLTAISGAPEDHNVTVIICNELFDDVSNRLCRHYHFIIRADALHGNITRLSKGLYKVEFKPDPGMYYILVNASYVDGILKSRGTSMTSFIAISPLNCQDLKEKVDNLYVLILVLLILTAIASIVSLGAMLWIIKRRKILDELLITSREDVVAE